jgi:PPK2 family polyphosphate:nucleotide phosphotransferase
MRAFVVRPGTKVKLSDHDPGRTDDLDKAEGKRLTKALALEIEGLQEMLFASGTTSLLCIFQGMDTAGKDGAIDSVLQYMNVQSCHVAPFRAPTAEELAHDFLWRVHAKTPRLGGITLFNRSHYEDVLIVRVKKLVEKRVWSARFEQINEFEELLTTSGTKVLKFFLHISKEEQEKRLLDREKDPLKAWKLNVLDWKERERWDDYMAAYEDALSKCSTKHAKWMIVPSDHKWFRDLCIAEAIAGALRPHKRDWEAHLKQVGREAKRELRDYRRQQD